MSVVFHENPGTSLGDVELRNDTNEQSETPDWIQKILPNNTFIDGEIHQAVRGYCRKAIEYELPIFPVRYWDAAILTANLIFFLFLLFNIKAVLRKLSLTSSPVFRAFFFLVYAVTLLNILRCSVSIGISVTTPLGEILNRVLWFSLKFLAMTTELCVLTFAVLFGHLDSSTSIRRAFLLVAITSLGHTGLQLVLELGLVHKNLLPEDLFFDFETQGGLVLWFLTSLIFAFIYLFFACLPLTCCRRYVTLPSKCSFYWYCIILAALNIIQALGVVMLFFRLSDGYCLTLFTTFNYFTFLPPLIYFTFLRKLLKRPASTNNGLFSYRKQKDERGTGDLPESYYPRFSGLTSPSYDDLFGFGRSERFADSYDYTRDYLNCPYDTPLMTSEPAESTITTRTAGSSDDMGHQRDSMMWSGSIEMGPRQLKGLGANGTLIFEE